MFFCVAISSTEAVVDYVEPKMMINAPLIAASARCVTSDTKSDFPSEKA